MRCHPSLSRAARLVPFKLQVWQRIHGSDSHGGSQQPRQNSVVLAAHATLTKLVKLPELICLSGSNVYYLWSQCKSAPGKPRPAVFLSTLSLLRNIWCCGFTCCPAKALSPLPTLQPLLQVLQMLQGHSKECAELLMCSAFGPMCPCNLD